MGLTLQTQTTTWFCIHLKINALLDTSTFWVLWAQPSLNHSGKEIEWLQMTVCEVKWGEGGWLICGSMLTRHKTHWCFVTAHFEALWGKTVEKSLWLIQNICSKVLSSSLMPSSPSALFSPFIPLLSSEYLCPAHLWRTHFKSLILETFIETTQREGLQIIH